MMFEQLALNASKNNVMRDVDHEMSRQVTKWGVQNHKSITEFSILRSDVPANELDADFARGVCDKKSELGFMSWTDILLEEVFEAIDEAREGNLEALREELVQVAAVALSWVMSIDRNAH